jgi:phosphate/phosphite/phosphonate ABC transporter binding protein
VNCLATKRSVLLGLIGSLLACEPSLPEPSQSPPPVIDRDALIEEARNTLAEAGVTELRWGVTPYVLPEKVISAYVPMTVKISRALGVEAGVVLADTYENLEDKMLAGEIDVGVMTPYSYVRTHDRNPKVRVFASHIARGSVSYGSYIVAREDGPVRSLEDVRGRKFAFVSKASTSGFLFAASRMLDAKLHPLEDVQPVFLGSHDAVLRAVADGVVDAGATYDGAIVDSLQALGSAVSFRVLAKGPRIPHDPYVVGPTLPDVVQDALALLFTDISTQTEEGRSLLAPFLRINGFVRVDNSHYDVIRSVQEQVVAALGEDAVMGFTADAPSPEGPTLDESESAPDFKVEAIEATTQ